MNALKFSHLIKVNYLTVVNLEEEPGALSHTLASVRPEA